MYVVYIIYESENHIIIVYTNSMFIHEIFKIHNYDIVQILILLYVHVHIVMVLRL